MVVKLAARPAIQTLPPPHLAAIERRHADNLGSERHFVKRQRGTKAHPRLFPAAVHSGLMTFQQGGSVTIELRAGIPIYGTSERNGVTPSVYGSYGSSFVFKTPNTESVLREADEQTPVLWNTSATMVGGDNGKTWKFKCPANGKEATVWGTDVYTLDSLICNAAVHAAS